MDIYALVIENTQPFEHAHTEIAGLIGVVAAIQATFNRLDGFNFQSITAAGKQTLCKFGAWVFLCELFADGGDRVRVDSVLLRKLPHRQAGRTIRKNSLLRLDICPLVRLDVLHW